MIEWMLINCGGEESKIYMLEIIIAFHMEFLKKNSSNHERF
jgi:hypothetical protein